MKNTHLKSLLVFLSMAFTFQTFADKVITINGETLTKDAAKIQLNGNNVLLTYADGTTTLADMSTVLVRFSELTSTPDLTADSYSLNTIATSLLQINGVNNGDKIAVYNANGKLMLAKSVAGNSAVIDVHAYPAGIYLLRINKSTVKFVKK